MTRPAAQAATWVADLRANGIDAEALPLIEIGPPTDPVAVQQAWRLLPQRRLLVFVSPSAVERFFAARPAGTGWPAQTLAAAPGPGTRSALLRQGVAADRVIEPAADSAQFDSQSLWQRLSRASWSGASVLFVRGDGGREWLAEQLSAAGARVDAVSAYRRDPPRLDAATRQRLLGALTEAPLPAWLFSSSEAVDHLEFAAPLPSDALRRHLLSATALATHPRIAQRAIDAGFARVVACRPTLDGVVGCLQSLSAERPRP